jgi:hypothetical protein
MAGKIDSKLPGLRGFAHADAIVRIIALVIKHSNFDPATMDPLMKRNYTILSIYINHITEDESSATGLAYADGSYDELVRVEAETALGAPINLHQVSDVRRFMATLFLSGSCTTEDTRRIRRMFLGHFNVD